jgi:hypothetical protein
MRATPLIHLLTCVAAVGLMASSLASDTRVLLPVENDLQTEIRLNILRLSTSSYQVAMGKLVEIGAPAVPALIEALKVEDGDATGSHVMQAADQYTRDRPPAEIAYAVLRDILITRSNYNGPLPARDYAAWMNFWKTTSSALVWGEKKHFSDVYPKPEYPEYPIYTPNANGEVVIPGFTQPPPPAAVTPAK